MSRSEPGRLSHTYVAALQHDFADVPEDALRLGVVRRPAPWFHAQVDENDPALGPPPDLLDEVKDRAADLEAEGLDDPAAHNRAMADVDFERRYLAHVEGSEAAREAVERIERLLDGGRDVVLVCYEDTDEKRCHRTLLLDVIGNGPDSS